MLLFFSPFVLVRLLFEGGYHSRAGFIGKLVDSNNG